MHRTASPATKGTRSRLQARTSPRRRYGRSAVLLLAQAVIAVAPICARAAEPPTFSAGALNGWHKKNFSGRQPTGYRLVTVGGSRVLQATCHDSASGLIWKHHVDLSRTPVLTWRWRISRVFPALDPHKKSGDDYPARVYVVAGNPLLPWTIRSIVYVWANGVVQAPRRGPHGDPLYPDPYTSQAKIIAIQEGAAKVGHWVAERRNVRADFIAAFGSAPKHIDAVAVMTDCDNSHESGQAWYGNIALRDGQKSQ